MESKICKQCKIKKPISEYHHNGWYNKSTGKRVRLYKAECKLCANHNIKSKRSAQMTEIVVNWMCARCGYDKCINALEFHHKDPTQKEFTIGSTWTMSQVRLKSEIDKCVILCANCHRELHAGIWDLNNMQADE